MAKATIVQGTATYEWTFTPPMGLEEILTALGLHFPHPCGGRGKCGKCAVSVEGAASALTQAEREANSRLSCQTVLLGDATVILPDVHQLEQIQFSHGVTGADPMEGDYGAAVDLGTTTLALSLYDLQQGTLLAQSGCANPQGVVAADVIGRIQAAMEGALEDLSQMMQNAILGLLQEACTKAEVLPEQVKTLILTGNTTMLYLLTNRDPDCLSHAPFEADTLFGMETRLLDRNVFLPKCMNAFVGADITCALLASGLCDREETALLCDLGTNGELALWVQGQLYVTSTAAGPAFEGAGISCGCGSIPGAVDRAWVENGALCLHTIGDLPAVGLCGSGLMDLVAAGLELEIIEDTGAMEEPWEFAPGVSLLPKDVRAVQLAKAAIAAGIYTMLQQAGLKPEEVQRLYVAGGFGSHLNLSSAVAIGLVPPELEDRAVILGNAALTGASQILLNRHLWHRAESIGAMATHVNLGGNPVFNQQYMEQMLFPED